MNMDSIAPKEFGFQAAIFGCGRQKTTPLAQTQARHSHDETVGANGDTGYLEQDDVTDEDRQPLPPKPETWNPCLHGALDVEFEFWNGNRGTRSLDFRLDVFDAALDSPERLAAVVAEWGEKRDAWCLDKMSDRGAFRMQTVPASEGGVP